MNSGNFKRLGRVLTALAGLLPCGCALGPVAPSSPLFGTWTTPDHNQVALRPDAVVIIPDKGQATTLGPTDCNGVYRLLYGRMETVPLENAFAAQPDLRMKLKQLLRNPEYPVADVTCDHGGTTYLLLDDRQMLAIYRDAGVGGIERYTRL